MQALPTNYTSQPRCQVLIQAAAAAVTYLAVSFAFHFLAQQLQHLCQWVAAGAWWVTQSHMEGGTGIKGVTSHLERVGSTAWHMSSSSTGSERPPAAVGWLCADISRATVQLKCSAHAAVG